MRPATYRSQRAWQQASIRSREFADAKLSELRARSPITAPTGRFFRFLSRVPRADRDAEHPAIVACLCFGCVFAVVGVTLLCRYL